jgi:hypothetical protein
MKPKCPNRNGPSKMCPTNKLYKNSLTTALGIINKIAEDLYGATNPNKKVVGLSLHH